MQPGQRVVEGLVGQSLVSLVLGGDVLKLEHEQVRLAVHARDQHPYPTHPDRGPVGAHQTKFADARVERSGDDSASLLGRILEVVWMDYVTNPVCQEPRFVIPEKVAQRAVDDPEGAVQVGQGDTDRGGCQHGADQILGRGQAAGALGCQLLFGHVAGRGEHAEHLAAGVAVHRGVVQNLGQGPVPVAHRQRVVHRHPLGEHQLVDRVGLLGFGEVVGEGGPDELLAGDAGDLDRGLVDVGDLSAGADRHQGVHARLDQAPGVLGCIRAFRGAAAGDVPRKHCEGQHEQQRDAQGDAQAALECAGGGEGDRGRQCGRDRPAQAGHGRGCLEHPTNDGVDTAPCQRLSGRLGDRRLDRLPTVVDARRTSQRLSMLVGHGNQDAVIRAGTLAQLSN